MPNTYRSWPTYQPYRDRVDVMRITWKPRANNFWTAVLEEGIDVPLRFSGTEYGSTINDIGYVAKELNGFVVRFYGSVYSGKLPIERIVFKTKEEAETVLNELKIAVSEFVASHKEPEKCIAFGLVPEHYYIDTK